jgi:tetrahydromethanopterin S-methyltransferase subunit B
MVMSYEGVRRTNTNENLSQSLSPMTPILESLPSNNQDEEGLTPVVIQKYF